jgi:hypothetical protein
MQCLLHTELNALPLLRPKHAHAQQGFIAGDFVKSGLQPVFWEDMARYLREGKVSAAFGGTTCLTSAVEEGYCIRG